MTTSTAGHLLVASPAISDGIFDRAIVFMLHHDPMGALGVIINRPSELAIDELLPRWSDLSAEPAVIFDGGPVEPNGFIGVAQAIGATPIDETVGARVGRTDVYSIDLEGDPMFAAAALDRLRIFRGYAGWAPNQLDGELRSGGWFIVDAEVGDVWSEDPATLYERVLRRQSSELKWFANAPADPTLN